MELLCRNLLYPYDWIDNIDKFIVDGIPSIESFHSIFDDAIYFFDSKKSQIKINRLL